jgi:hypothetical protein
MTREEHIHLANPPRGESSAVQPLLDQIGKLQLERDQLKTESSAGNARVAELSRELPH